MQNPLEEAESNSLDTFSPVTPSAFPTKTLGRLSANSAASGPSGN